MPLHFQTGNGAGLGSLCSIAEQPVLSTKGKGADGVLCQVVGDRHFAIAQKCRKLLVLVQTVAHRFFQLAALFRVECFQPRIILLQKGQFLVLAVFLAILWFIGSAFSLLCKQFVAVLEANSCFAGFYRCALRHGFPPFSSGVGPAAAMGDLGKQVIALVVIRHESTGKAL